MAPGALPDPMLASDPRQAAVPRASGRILRALRIRPLLAILAVSVALRLAVAVYMGDEVAPLPGIFDQLAYDRLAQSLLAGRGYQFATAWYPFTPAGTPTAHWSFLYPLYLAGVYLFAGHHPLVARLIQAAVVGLLLPWLAYRLGGRLFGRRAALLAAAAMAGYGYFIYYNAALMTESFYLVFIVAAVAVAYALAEDEVPPRWAWLALGLLLGGAVLLRQVFLLFMPVLLLWIGWRRGFRRAAPGLVAAAAVVLLVVLPWTARNYRHYGRFLLLNSNAGYAFYNANHPDHGRRWNPDLVAPIPVALAGLNEAALDRALMSRGLGFVAADPGRYLALTLSRVPYHFRFWPTAGSSPLSEAVRFFSFGLYLPFMIVGLLLSRRDWRRLLPLYLFALMFVAVHVFSWPGPRYRFPVDALMILFVGLALARLADWAAAAGHCPGPPMTSALAARPNLVALRRSLAAGRFQVALLVVIALAARLLFLALSGSLGRVINNDAADYLQIAQNLAAGRGFAFAAGEPTAFRPFGYPIFLALLALLGDPIIWVHLSQALVGSIAVWPAYLIARRFTAGPLPFLVAAGVAVHPVLIYLTALIAPETIALLAQLVVVCLALKMAANGARRPLDAAGLAVAGAVAVLMRPELLLLLGLLPAAVIWRRFAGRPVPSGGAIVAACFLAAALALAPLAVRNGRVLGHASPMPTIGGVTFWGANNAAAHGGWLLPAPELWPGADPPASMRGWPELDEYESQVRFYRASLDWMAANPARALALLPRKLLRGWSLSYADEAKASNVPAAAAAANWIFGALALLGIAVSIRSGPDGYWVLYAALLAWLLKTLVFYGSARQTALAVPIFLVFAGVALDWLVRRWRSRPG